MRSQAAAVSPQATTAMANAKSDVIRGGSASALRRALRGPTTGHGVAGRRSFDAYSSGRLRARRARRNGRALTDIVRRGCGPDQPDLRGRAGGSDGTGDSPGWSALAPHGRDHVPAVGLDLVLLVAVHQVEVELVDAGVGELAKFRDVLVCGTQDANRSVTSSPTNAALDEPTSA